MFFLPILAGVCFALIGAAYRLAQNRGVETPAVVIYMAAGGLIVFAAPWLQAGLLIPPGRVLMLALAGGLSQYATIKLCNAALKHGPLSPLWCALNLAFVPVVVYSWAALAESISVPSATGLVVGTGAVLAASKVGGHDEPTATKGRNWLYPAILMGSLFANAVLHGSVKDLGARLEAPGRSFLEGHEAAFFSIMYGTLLLTLLVEGARDGFAQARRWPAWTFGALAAIGSAGGMKLTALAVELPAPLVFAGSALTSLAGGALCSVLFFGERITRWWVLMMILAIAAVVLVAV